MNETDESLIRNVKSMLSAKYYKMNDTFLRDCVSYFINEQNSQNVIEIQDFVIAQWQLNDLREINTESGIFPPNLVQQQITTLQGTYNVQMDKMYDISVSKLKQIHTIRNVSSYNLEVTEAQNKESHDWNPKPKRMYQFFLTDGLQDVIAIEYKPLRQFKDVLLPGIKLMIIGPVVCRKGVILLEEKNIKEIGGEVGNLLITNALENILARSLNLPENPDPYKENETQTDNLESAFEDEFNVDDVAFIEHRNSRNDRSTPTSNTHTNTSSNNEFTGQNKDINNCQVAPVTNQSAHRNRSLGKQPSVQNTNADEFPDDLDEYFDLADDFDIDINYITTKADKLCSTENKSTIHIGPSTSTEAADLLKESKETKPTKVKKKDYLVDDIIEFPDDDFEWCDNVDTKNINDIKSKIQRKEEPCIPKIQQNYLLADDIIEFPDDDFEWCDNVDRNNINDIKPKIQRKEEPCIPKIQQNYLLADDIIEFPDDDFEWCDNVDTKNINDIKPKIQRKEEQRIPKIEHTRIQETITNFSELSRLSLNNTKIASPAKPTTSSGSSSPIIPAMTKNKRPASMVSPPVASPPKMKCIQETPKLSKVVKKITDFTEKLIPHLEEAQKTYDSICDVLMVTVADSTSVRRIIKAKVVTFDTLGKKNNCWHLEATLTDGSGSIDVTFASEVLERIIGFRVDKFSEMKRKGKTDPNIKAELRQVFRKAEIFVKKLDSLMELELSKDIKPIVIKIMNSPNE